MALDDNGRLYYANSTTERDLLSSSAISASWLRDLLEDCRAARQVLVLDCCHSGAHAKNSKGAEEDLHLKTKLGGRGHFTLTASNQTEYAFEGASTYGTGVSSVFTSVLMQGIRTGGADSNRDGVITMSEMYSYLYEHVRIAEPRQTPQLWGERVEGDFVFSWCPENNGFKNSENLTNPSEPTIPNSYYAQTRLTFRQAVEGALLSLKIEPPGGKPTNIVARIPSGVLSGQRIRLRGKGPAHPETGKIGDIVVTVDVEEDPLFKIENHNNIRVKIPVSFSEATMGAVIRVPAPVGEPILLRLPPGTPPGRIFRAKGRGIAGKTAKGDLLVQIEISIPPKVSKELADILTLLAPHLSAESERANIIRLATKRLNKK